jgi:hypothetical protein
MQNDLPPCPESRFISAIKPSEKKALIRAQHPGGGVAPAVGEFLNSEAIDSSNR